MKLNKIKKDEFIKLDEKDIMFITNPGRMGDEDGITFIIKEGISLVGYRLDGLMYPVKNKDIITLEDAKKQFPIWYKTWKDKKIKSKYKYLYMGFGNGLSIDKSIYKEYKPYLETAIKKYLENNNVEKYVATYAVWSQALDNIIKKKND